MITELTEKEVTALTLLRSACADVIEAALIAKEALAANRGQVRRARRCLAAGVEELRKQERTVSFERAVEAGWKHERRGGNGQFTISGISRGVS